MNTLREAVRDYLDMRRSLGFKLQETQARGCSISSRSWSSTDASYITQALALAWAQQPSNVQPAYWAHRLSFVRRICTLSQRHRSAHADSAAGPVALPTEAGATLSVLRGRDPQLTARRSPDALSL